MASAPDYPLLMDTTILPVVFDTVCGADDPLITARVAGETYDWSSGQDTRSIIVPVTGTFTATITDTDGNVTIDEHRVTSVSVPDPILPTVLPPGPYCAGQEIVVTVALSGYDAIEWNDGRGNRFPGFGPNNDSVRLSIFPGSSITYIADYQTCRTQVTVLPPLQFDEDDFGAVFTAEVTGPDEPVCLDSALTLSVIGTAISRVSWADGSTETTRDVRGHGGRGLPGYRHRGLPGGHDGGTRSGTQFRGLLLTRLCR